MILDEFMLDMKTLQIVEIIIIKWSTLKNNLLN